MIRLTLFYLFSFSAVVSVLLLFFTKNIFKIVLLFFNAFLASSFVCIIFRHPGPAVCILISGIFFSILFIYFFNRLSSETVQAKGVTPKFFKILSGLCCLSLFFFIIFSASELKDRTPDIQESVPVEKNSVPAGFGAYSAMLAALSLSVVFPGSRLLIYHGEGKDA